MSLKTDYNFNTAMSVVYDLGNALIQATPTPTPQYTILSNELAAAAAAGKKEFTVNLSHNAIGENLELQGAYWDTYVTGIHTSLATEGIYIQEVSISLNTETAGNSTLDLNFTF